MEYKFPYSWAGSLEIPDGNLVGVYGHGTIRPKKAELEIIKEAILNPIGTPPIREMVRAGQKVLIISDDNTRATPVWKILEGLLPELYAGGIRKEDIKIIIASGTHRPMTKLELEKKLGKYVQQFPILEHRWFDESTLYFHKKTKKLGIEIWPNIALKEADFIIGIGMIIPHAVAGFSGGGKIIVPGVCGEATNGQMHWGMVKFRPEEIFGVYDNPVRQIINEVAREIPLNLICNAIINNYGEIVYLVVGDSVEAHKEGCKLCRSVHGVRIPQRADIVIIDSFGADIDYWQAIKAMTPAGLVMKEDGIVIHVCECPEGVSRSHPEVLKYGYVSEREVLELERQGKINKTVAVHMVQASRVITDKGKGILVCPNINKQDAEKLGFIYASTPKEALNRALEIKGKDASIIGLRQGGDLLPLMS